MSASGPPAGMKWMRLNKRTNDACSVERDSRDEIRVSIHFRETFRIVNVCEGRKREISPKVGTVAMVPPGSCYVQTITGVASGLVFSLPWQRMAEWITHETDVAPERVQMRLCLGVEDHVLARALLTLAGGQPIMRDEATHTVLGCLFGSHSNQVVAGRARRASGGLAPFKLARFIDQVEADIGGGLSVRDVACSLGYTEAHFIRQFKATMGVTPYRYVIDRRLEKALEALLTRKANVADIAVQAGFTHASHLSRMLRRRFGVTAGSFRRSVFPPRLLDADLKI